MLDRNSIFTETPKPKQDKIKNRNSAETEYSAEIALFRPKLPYFGRNSLISAEKPPFWPKLSYFCDIKMGTLCHVFDNKLEEKFTNSPKMDLYRPKLIHFGRNKTITAEIWLFRPKHRNTLKKPKEFRPNIRHIIRPNILAETLFGLTLLLLLEHLK